MKFLFLVLSMTEIIFAQSRFSVPHLELEMTGAEYQSFFRGSLDDEFDGELEPVMRIGKKYLDWLKKVNENRPEGMKLSLSSPENQPGYPIESPRVSSPKLILESLSQLKSQLPEELKSTVLGSTQINHVLPVSDEVFVFWGRQIDELYARASRWLLQEPYLWAYADRKHDDVRGYYYLSRVLEVEEKLLQWKNLSQETQTQYQIWLEGLCFNGGSSSSECREEFQETIQKIGHPKDFYLKFLPKGQEKWAGLFNITQKRDDIIWKGEELKTLKTPFTQPESQEVKTFLSENIEDEWKWKDWRLTLNFISGGFDTTHVEFVPGATPHVNGLAGSTITMDANQPLTEYHVRWTIRHEFGHTLGFPDCYVEFYDTDKAVMISYQLDTTNLMCSRRGKLQEKHYEELKRVYYTP